MFVRINFFSASILATYSLHRLNIIFLLLLIMAEQRIIKITMQGSHKNIIGY